VVSQTPVDLGHGFMTNSSNSPDLVAIARTADVEILTAETLGSASMVDDSAVDSSAAELGYYEAELGSLRDAATSLDQAEHPTR
jgi:hypothetical protein